MPLARRLPKRGFTNIFRTEYTIVNLKSLSTLKESVSHQSQRSLREAGSGKGEKKSDKNPWRWKFGQRPLDH